MIDNLEHKIVTFFDKNNKISHYNIHLVNKCNNKRFLKRYEHYKKVFYEKMEERFAKIQKKKEERNQNNPEIEVLTTKTNKDLNKTL